MKSDTKWRMTMKTDYITSGSTLPPYLAYPRFLLGMNIRLTAKEVYAIMLDMTLNSEAQSLRELEDVGLVEKKLIALHTPYHIYIKLPTGENEP